MTNMSRTIIRAISVVLMTIAVLYLSAKVAGASDVPITPELTANPTPEMMRYIVDQANLKALAIGKRDPRMNGVQGEGPYQVKVLSALDGDTFQVRFITGDCGELPCPGAILSIRSRYIDSGETKAGEGQSNAQCQNELDAGQAAKVFASALKTAAAVEVYHYGPDPYNSRGVASVRFKTQMIEPWKYYHVEALQMLDKNGKNIFAYYDPKANERLRKDDKAFEKRKIWCE